MCTVPVEGQKLNLKGLRAEVTRKAGRLFKKAVQANDRVSKTLLELQSPSADTATLQDALDLVRVEASVYSEQLKEVKQLEEKLANIKSTSDPLFQSTLLPIITRYNITDAPPPPPERGPKKVKSPPTPSGPRMPYNVFISLDNIEIRVGRRAEDNDELSCNPQHRDGPDWWLHVAGHPGSHVVIRCQDDDLPSAYRETLKDAAALAAKNSKAAASNNIQVTYTRCRNVSKLPGAKAGL